MNNSISLWNRVVGVFEVLIGILLIGCILMLLIGCHTQVELPSYHIYRLELSSIGIDKELRIDRVDVSRRIKEDSRDNWHYWRRLNSDNKLTPVSYEFSSDEEFTFVEFSVVSSTLSRNVLKLDFYVDGQLVDTGVTPKHGEYFAGCRFTPCYSNP